MPPKRSKSDVNLLSKDGSDTGRNSDLNNPVTGTPAVASHAQALTNQQAANTVVPAAITGDQVTIPAGASVDAGVLAAVPLAATPFTAVAVAGPSINGPGVLQAIVGQVATETAGASVVPETVLGGLEVFGGGLETVHPNGTVSFVPHGSHGEVADIILSNIVGLGLGEELPSLSVPLTPGKGTATPRNRNSTTASVSLATLNTPLDKLSNDCLEHSLQVNSELAAGKLQHAEHHRQIATNANLASVNNMQATDGLRTLREDVNISQSGVDVLLQRQIGADLIITAVQKLKVESQSYRVAIAGLKAIAATNDFRAFLDRVDSIEATLEALQEQVGEQSTSIAILDGAVNGLATRADNIDARIRSTEANCKTDPKVPSLAHSLIESCSPTVSALIDTLTETNNMTLARVNAVEANMTNVNSQLSTLPRNTTGNAATVASANNYNAQHRIASNLNRATQATTSTLPHLTPGQGAVYTPTAGPSQGGTATTPGGAVTGGGHSGGRGGGNGGRGRGKYDPTKNWSQGQQDYFNSLAGNNGN